MNEKLKEKIRESLASVLPITGIVLLLSITLVPMEVGTLVLFLTGAILLIVGMGFFQLGAEIAMTPLGKGVGGCLMKNRRLLLIIVACFLMGAFITIAEPDLQVLANQVASIPNRVLIWVVAVGVGIFLVVAVLRIWFQISLTNFLLIFYILLFGLSFLAPEEFTAVAFDAGGVTTGPMTVPFIMALGAGFSAARSDKKGADDSFGLIALCSIGPIMMVLLLGIFYHPTDAAYNVAEIPALVTTYDVIRVFLSALPEYAAEVLTSILPVACVLLVFQIFTRYYHKRQLLRMVIGLVYTILGLILFLTGVNVGFAPIGSLLGSSIGGSRLRWLLLPGYLIALVLSRLVPPVFVGIAFDSGGVASGPMTSTFLLPLAIGACSASGGNVVTDAFGIVALVALAPLIAIQIMGLLYTHKSRRIAVTEEVSDDGFVDFEE